MLLVVRSPNSARAAGVKIGRALPNVRASDKEVLRIVDAQVVPQIKLLRSKEERRAEEIRGLVWLFAVLAVMSAVVTAGLLIPNPLLARIPTVWGFPSGLATALFMILSATAWLFWRGAKEAAQDKQAAETNALRAAAFEGVIEELNKRRLQEGVPLRRSHHREASAPDRVPGGVTPRGAEALVAQWMRHLGETTAETTQFQGDGGVDVAGARYIAQVKHFAVSVGVASIRELAGVAIYDGRAALFFTSTGYSKGAVEFAEKSGVALFVYDAKLAELRGINEFAIRLLEVGLGALEGGIIANEARTLLAAEGDAEDLLETVELPGLARLKPTTSAVSSANAVVFVEALTSNSGWLIDQALKLLVNRQDPAVADAVKSLDQDEVTMWESRLNVVLIRATNAAEPIEEVRRAATAGAAERAGAALLLTHLVDTDSAQSELLSMLRRDRDATVRYYADAEVLTDSEYWSCRPCGHHNEMTLTECSRCNHSPGWLTGLVPEDEGDEELDPIEI
ncbi:restriction endonuclease [Cryobacterium sp. BB307]|uniref:restriction endonuclease n=1 Tax=Cryobacterium sp. BB307 TaxID=2716317 RepID=UPI001444EC64|nr:restriction endonuclease [Cryobacterium sp. BB307]